MSTAAGAAATGDAGICEMHDSSAITLGEVVRRFRSEAGLSQEELAERAGLSPRTVSNIETGAASSPRAMTLALLSGALRLDADKKERLFAAARPRKWSLSELGAEPLAKLLEPFGQAVKLDVGERLFARGAPGATMYLIVSGSVHLVESGVDLGPGSFVGEIAIFSPQAKRTQSAIATCEARLLEVSADDMPAVHRRYPDFGAHLLRLVTTRLLENIARLQARDDGIALVQTPAA